MRANRFTWAQDASIVDQHVYSTGLSKHPIDDALPILFVSDIQDELSETQ